MRARTTSCSWSGNFASAREVISIPSLTIEEIDDLDPNYIGPVWQRDDQGEWVLPARTLGWTILGWCSRWLNAKESTQDHRVPWTFTPEQARFILHFYALDDYGRFQYRRGLLQRLKGWGPTRTP